MNVADTIALAAGCGVGVGLLMVLLGLTSRKDQTPRAARPINEGPLARIGNFVAPATGPHARERRQAIAIGAPLIGAAVWLASGIPVFGSWPRCSS